MTDPLADIRDLFVEHVNSSHEDSLVLVGRVLGRRPDATTARITAIDLAGLDLELGTQAGPAAVRLDFHAPITSADDLTGAAFGLVGEARRQSGEPGRTSAEQLMAEMQEIRTMITTVSAVEDIGPHLRQITFKGGDLDTFTPFGPDTFLYVLLPPPGRTQLTIDQSFTWEAHGRMPEAERPVGAYYTLRRWRPETSELDAHFVLHGDEGPASAWALRAEVGDLVALWGPRTAWNPPALTTHYLLVADETGLPAVGAILEFLGDEVAVTIVAETDGPVDRPELPSRDGVEVLWVDRDGAPPGTTTLLPDAVAALDLDVDGLYAYGGAESRAVTAVRKLLRRERGCTREQVSMVGYWRHALSPTEGDEDDE